MSDTRAAFLDSDVNWELAPAEDSWSRQLVQLITKTLPEVPDSDHAALLRECAFALTDHDEHMRAGKEVLSASLTLLHTQQALLVIKDAALRRLHESYAALVSERRQDRSAA